jgi:RNA polymerase sigma-70 factor (ECF subfamily)
VNQANAQVPVRRSKGPGVASSGSPNAGAFDRDGRFAACFELYYPRVLGYGLRRLPDREAAEDAAAETFLVAWRRFDDAPPDQLPWLLAIARNVIYNESRSARRRDRLAARVAAERGPIDQQPAADEIPERNDGSVGIAAAAHAALERLSDRDREILLLTSWDGLSGRRAAAALGCSPGTFAVRLHRARTRFARALNAPSLSEPSTSEESR